MVAEEQHPRHRMKLVVTPYATGTFPKGDIITARSVAEQLAAWMAGGHRPTWIEFLRRQSPSTAFLAFESVGNYEIRAVGLLVDDPVKPDWKFWNASGGDVLIGRKLNLENEPIYAWEMMEAICKGCRPTFG